MSQDVFVLKEDTDVNVTEKDTNTKSDAKIEVNIRDSDISVQFAVDAIRDLLHAIRIRGKK